MTYTGDVVVGGPPQVRELDGVRITKVATPPFDNNCYLVRCTSTGATLLVDAAGDARTLLSLVGDGKLVAVVETHSHWDHVQALAEVRTATGARVVAHAADAGDLPVPADRLVEHGDAVGVGELSLEVLHLRGHTPGSIALVLRTGDTTHLFSGDSLFPGGPGNTDKDPSRFAQLMTDLETRVFAVLPDDTRVYPGHGADTTLGAERPSLPQWRARGW
jgi:glyoxylase-like metal-dependent hydrolase (beta-lactamase superfamily II)